MSTEITTTKITGITPAHIALIEAIEIVPVERGRSFVVLNGAPREALAALTEARGKHSDKFGRSEGNLFGTLTRKLGGHLAAETPDVADAREDEARGNVVNGPWEYPAAEGPVTSDDEAEAVMVTNADAEAQAAANGLGTPDEIDEELARLDRIALAEGEAPVPTAEKKAPRKPRAKKAGKGAEKADAPKPTRTRKVELPKGYVTISGLAKAINEAGLYTGGRSVGLTGAALGAYVAQHSDPKSRTPFPLEVFDGTKVVPFSAETYAAGADGRVKVVQLKAGLEWWAAKNERSAGRKASK